MAEGVLFELAGTVLEGLGKAAIKEAASWWGARDDLKKLEKTINLIQARVRDAERHREEEGSDAIKEWLRRLRMVLYQVDDLFDLVLTVDCQKQRIEVDKQDGFDVDVGEALAARHSLAVALDAGFRRVTLETDSLKLFQHFKS